MDPTTMSIPLVGGPGDGTRVLVVIGPDGRPSLTMCIMGEGGLADAAVYELEALDAEPEHWCYRFRVTSESGADL
jgi:hypothetical protein